MLMVLILLVLLAVVATAATIRSVARDGYRRVPLRRSTPTLEA
jgi:hypothetical protein